MDGFSPNSRPAAAASLLDLEMPIIDSKAAASVASIVIDEVLTSRHPGLTPPEGYTVLMLDDATIEALNHSITNLLAHTRKAADAYYAVAHADR